MRDDEYLRPTPYLDFEHARVASFVEETIVGATDHVSKAERLFYAVRDGIWYDPYTVRPEPASYRASAVLEAGRAWCVPKAVVLAAAARRCGIPARLGFADVKNHLTSERLHQTLGTDLYVWHGYAELWLNERWVKLSVAFNAELCARFGLETLEFDPEAGALLHPYDEAGNRHMEYVRERGSYADLPLEEILTTFAEVYPKIASGRGDGSPRRSEVDPAFER